MIVGCVHDEVACGVSTSALVGHCVACVRMCCVGCVWLVVWDVED